MRLAHLSDLHFGSEDPLVVEGLLADLDGLRPNAIAVSGDLTQRARAGEFAAARSFVEALPAPAVVVAGNHDVPVLSLRERFTDPYGRYRRGLGPELQPRLRIDGLFLVGLNTARANTRKSGRLNRSQLSTLERTLTSAPDDALRALVTHHPFIPPPERPDASIVGRARLALRAIERARVDVVLSGHRHVRHAELLPVPAPGTRSSLVVVLAGTASSRRHRGERNSYNLIEGDRDEFAVTVREWEGGSFVPASMRRLVRGDDGWAYRES
jgi:3',5'-cyclic AMP phosphodiesterase CpdA